MEEETIGKGFADRSKLEQWIREEPIPLPQGLRGLALIRRAIRSMKGFKWRMTGTNLCFRKILLDATRWRMDYKGEGGSVPS